MVPAVILLSALSFTSEPSRTPAFMLSAFIFIIFAAVLDVSVFPDVRILSLSAMISFPFTFPASMSSSVPVILPDDVRFPSAPSFTLRPSISFTSRFPPLRIISFAVKLFPVIFFEAILRFSAVILFPVASLTADIPTFCPVIFPAFTLSPVIPTFIPCMSSAVIFPASMTIFFEIAWLTSAFPFIFSLRSFSEMTGAFMFTPTPFSVEIICICPLE